MNTFHIANMDCAAEEAEIRRALDGIAGVRALRFSLGERTLKIDAAPDALDAAVAALARAGFPPVPVTVEGGGRRRWARWWALWGRLGLSLLLALGAEALHFAGIGAAGLAVAVVAIWLAGFEVYAKGLAALRQGRLNISALMTVAVTGAFLIGQWPEAAMVMALYALAEAIEARAVDRARGAIASLMALAPGRAQVRQPDGSWVEQFAGDIPLEAVVRIRPGERVPLDGVVLTGQSAIDQSAVTGESLPVDKAPGDEVFAGTINQTAALEIRVTAPAGDSLLARIVHAVEQAQGTRAPTQRFVDAFSAWYTPVVFVLALGVAALAPWLLGWPWQQAAYKALVLLVIACPCALVISTPVTVVSALAAAARRGILIKGGVYLEDARKIRAVALDKTGTLTTGKPQLVAFESVATDVPAEEAQALARSLAERSDHPVSRALAAGLRGAVREVDGFHAMAGRGVAGRIAGQAYVLGNHRWMEEGGQCSPGLQARLLAHEQAGRTVTLLADDRRVLAIAAVADTLKPGSAQAVAELKALGVRTVMLTGDNEATARTVGTQAGVDDIRGNLLPGHKLDAVAALQERSGFVAMVGDGINDAPALAQAQIGFAMGGAGSHTALEAADIVVMNDDLRRLPETIRLSQRAHGVLWQNIALALGIKAVFLVLALVGQATLWMAVFADMGASLLVVFNGLRLVRGVAGDEPAGHTGETTGRIDMQVNACIKCPSHTHTTDGR